MRITQLNFAVEWWALFQRSFVRFVAVAVLVCMSPTLTLSQVRLVVDDAESPFEQEERETEEEVLKPRSIGKRRQRLGSNGCTYRLRPVPSIPKAQQSRVFFAGCSGGHRLSNGLIAPLVC